MAFISYENIAETLNGETVLMLIELAGEIVGFKLSEMLSAKAKRARNNQHTYN